MQQIAPWLVLLAFSALTWWATPRKVGSAQFFDGRRDNGNPPGVWMVAMSAAITRVFAKSIANASDLAYGYGCRGHPCSGITFCLLALVQIFSYPFHDPVLSDRGFLGARPVQSRLPGWRSAGTPLPGALNLAQKA